MYKLSNIENSRAAAWSPSKQRFIDEMKYKRNLPGPGDYNPSDTIGGTTQYLLSNFKNYGTSKIMPNSSSSRHRGAYKLETPGPGTYVAASDFGHFEQYSKPTSPRPKMNSPGRNARTATLHSTRTKVRRGSYMSERNGTLSVKS